ncbi:MAG: Sua5/YciO/YrdC/YwlC family protein [Mariprofundus sp.]|nr:Sua5/YciO/YrdC/YwlC family protein [Mariprofundus sp.]
MANQRSSTINKLAALRCVPMLQWGGLLAHDTATLPGITACATRQAANKLVQFKQRKGPFILLADSTHTASHLARHLTPELRCLMRNAWPGPVTLLLPAIASLPHCFQQNGFVAVRVDASLQVRQLARACGGLLISSSLNRRGKNPSQATLKNHMRLHRFLRARLVGPPAGGHHSSIIQPRRKHANIIHR